MAVTAITPTDTVAPPRSARGAVSALFFLNGAMFATWAARLPAVQDAYGLSHSGLGMALLMISLGAVIAMPVAGWLTAHRGSASVSRIAVVVFCALVPLLVLAPNVPSLFAALFCFGAFHGGLDVAMNAQAVEVEKAYRRPIMSSFHALWSTGGLAGAATGGLLAGAGLELLPHFIAASLVFGAVALAAIPFLQKGPDPHRSAGSTEPAMPIFRLPSRSLLGLGVIAFCVMIGEGAMADWSAVYLHTELGVAESTATLGYAAFSIAMAAGRFLGDRCTERWSAVGLVRIGTLIAAAGLALALAIPLPAVALVGFGCVGLGFATIVPLVFSAAGRKPGIAPGIALASVTTLGYLGFLLGPPVIGFFSEGAGLRWALGLIVLTTLIATSLAKTVNGQSD
jgi:predicted MFS family arabinose efflux permease